MVLHQELYNSLRHKLSFLPINTCIYIFVIRFDIIVNEDSEYRMHSLSSLFLFSSLEGQ